MNFLINDWDLGWREESSGLLDGLSIELSSNAEREIIINIGSIQMYKIKYEIVIMAGFAGDLRKWSVIKKCEKTVDTNPSIKSGVA